MLPALPYGTRAQPGRESCQVQKSSISKCGALLVAVPEPGIEKVSEEVDRLATLLPGAKVLRGSEATIEAFRTRAGGCDLMHLATHGLYRSDNPLFSGLRFADGWLMARDLYEMALKCDLATLPPARPVWHSWRQETSCSDFSADFWGRTRSVAASLWLADDIATAALMEQFYMGLSGGLSKAAALRAAQQHTLCLYPHPYHWAAFILIGER